MTALNSLRNIKAWILLRISSSVKPFATQQSHYNNYYFHSILLFYYIHILIIYHDPKIILGEGNGTPLQYSCLENPMDGGAWKAAVHGVTRSWTRLSDFTFTFHFMIWRRKWQPTPVFLSGESQGQPGGLPSLGSHRVGHDWSDLAAAAARSSQLKLVFFSYQNALKPHVYLFSISFYKLHLHDKLFTFASISWWGKRLHFQ